jgi:hypothetical protein
MRFSIYLKGIFIGVFLVALVKTCIKSLEPVPSGGAYRPTSVGQGEIMEREAMKAKLEWEEKHE